MDAHTSGFTSSYGAWSPPNSDPILLLLTMKARFCPCSYQGVWEKESAFEASTAEAGTENRTADERWRGSPRRMLDAI